jgi:hypothetical protein
MSHLIRIGHGQSERFAELVIGAGKDAKSHNICDVLDGHVRNIPAGAKKFCREWLGKLPQVK